MEPKIVKAKKTKENVKVIVRCRPLSKEEKKAGHKEASKIHSEKSTVEVNNVNSNQPPKTYTFDTVYDESSRQSDIYNESFRPIVDFVLMGFNGTIFAYGQTGSGKTYTMEGDENNKGVIPNVFEHIFSSIEHSENIEYLISASYIEIYQEEIRDLLSDDSSKPYELKQNPTGNGVIIKDVTVRVCRNVKDLQDVLTTGKKHRKVGRTNMNLHSSRSHAIFMITVEQLELSEGELVKIGKLNLVDLAGSERLLKTGAIGDRQKESIKINLSLSALGNVINALVDGTNSYVPYRDSKLTRLLQDSLGGNSKTVMVANIGPADYNLVESHSTLRFASRAKDIKNSPVVNEDPKDALLKNMKQQIEGLKAELAARKFADTEKMRKREEKKKRRKQPKFSNNTDDNSDDSDNSFEMVTEAGGFMEMYKQYKHEKANLDMLDQEKVRYAQEVEEHDKLIQQENETNRKIQQSIEALEDQLLRGGSDIFDHTNEQEKLLEKQKQALADQKIREREIIRKLEEEEENTLEIRETYTTFCQEVEVKSKKLKKLLGKLENVKRDINEEQEINSRDRQEKEEIQDQLMRQLKYTNLVIDNFVPIEGKMKILKAAKYDEDENVWWLIPKDPTMKAALRPISVDGKSKRPICDHAKHMWKLTNSPRYASDNAIMIDLDFAALSVSDYEPPVVDPLVQSQLREIYGTEGESLTIEAGDGRFEHERRIESAYRRLRARTANSRRQTEENYPTPRGLVKRH